MAGKKTYKTAAGKDFDMESLRLKNEKVRAVGNMNVNARGDVVDGENKNVEPRQRRVIKQYDKQTSGRPPQPKTVESQPKKAEPAPEVAIEDEIANIAATAQTEEIAEAPEEGGLAGALAKARENKKTSE